MSKVVVVLEGAIARGDVAGLGARLRDRLDDAGAGVVVCDVGGLHRPDAVTLDTLARLRLEARRAGSRLVLRGATRDLLCLLDFAGLADVVPTARSEVGGEPEQREQLGVEEVRDPDDPPL